MWASSTVSLARRKGGLVYNPASWCSLFMGHKWWVQVFARFLKCYESLLRVGHDWVTELNWTDERKAQKRLWHQEALRTQMSVRSRWDGREGSGERWPVGGGGLWCLQVGSVQERPGAPPWLSSPGVPSPVTWRQEIELTVRGFQVRGGLLTPPLISNFTAQKLFFGTWFF